MKRSVGILLFLTGLCASGCAGTGARVDPAGTVPADARSPFLLEADSLEVVALRSAGGLARRVGNRLELRVASDSIIALVDSIAGGDAVVLYRLRPEFRDLGYFFVGVLFYEGSEFLLIHERTGQSLVVHGYEPPALSPDSRRLAAASGDFETGYHPNTIQIIRLEPDGPVMEWTFKTGGHDPMGGWAPSDPKWLSENTVALTMHLPGDGDARVPRVPRVPVWLDNTSRGWHVRTYRAVIDGVGADQIGTDTQTVQVNATMSEQLAAALAAANALAESLAPLIDTIVVMPERIELKLGETFPLSRLRITALDSSGRVLQEFPWQFRLGGSAARIAAGALEGVTKGEAQLRIAPLSTRRRAGTVRWPSAIVPVIVRP